MIVRALFASVLALSLAAGTVGAASAQTTPNSNNNSTAGAPGGDSGGNQSTGTGAAPSGK